MAASRSQSQTTEAAGSRAADRLPLGSALGRELQDISARGLRRFLRCIDGAQDTSVRIEGRDYLLFCSNNYLGLANHPEVVAAARDALARYGASAVSSRLVSGHMRAHARLEHCIAEWKGSEAALVFSTGYQANIGVITSLVGHGDLVVSDELNHASIIDGCRLASAQTAIYRHGDVEQLERILAGSGGAERVLIVTESVFSMDGDHAPLKAIAATARRYGAWLMVDEAHAAGVFGPGGAGLVEQLGLQEQVDIHMGTLGKALGSFGAYVAGSQALIDQLVNRARSFIFTTGLPPSAAAAAEAAIGVCKREPERARGLLTRARELGVRLRAAGLAVPNVESQILPVIIGKAQSTVAVAEALLARGIYVAAIRPPTVPEGTSRLRLSLMATHSREQIDAVAQALIETARPLR